MAVTARSSFTMVSESGSTKAFFAVSGMTCASCSNAVEHALRKKEWISNIAIDVVNGSATINYTRRDEDDEDEKIEEIVRTIEDIGYDAKHVKDHIGIWIDGFYDSDCPARVLRGLQGLQEQYTLRITKPPTLERPLLEVKYVAQAPEFTIRRILEAVQATDAAFHPCIYHSPTLEEEAKANHARYQQSIVRRVYFTLAISIPTFIIGIVYMSLVPDEDGGKKFLMDPWAAGINRAQIALLIMATPVFFYSTQIFHSKAIKEIRSLWGPNSTVPIGQRFYRFGSMSMLISLGTTIAYLSSCCQLLAAAITRPEAVDDTNFYFDSVVFLTLFLLVGRLIEEYSKTKTGNAVEMLGKLRPKTAILVEMFEDGQKPDRVVDVDLLDVGDLIRIPNGASPPCDGTVYKGETKFNEASLTGESALVNKSDGDTVFAGTVNKDAPILVRITGAAGQSMLDQIVNAVREGQTKRAPVEEIADQLTAYFVPVVILFAVVTWLVWLLLGVTEAIPEEYLDHTSGGWLVFSLQFAISVFVVACPCGLGLAAPTAIFVGGGLAAKRGILAKGGGEAFEKASRIDCVVFDKTGTLTKGGEPTITDSELYPDQDVLEYDEGQANIMLSVLRAVEDNSSHPIAKAIVAFCNSKNSTRAEVENVVEVSGRGLKASHASLDILVGNEALMKQQAVPVSAKVVARLHEWKSAGKSVVLVATKQRTTAPSAYRVTAILSISDPIRPEAAKVVSALRNRGIHVYMLSGDNATTARRVALDIGMIEENVIAEVLPSEKSSKILALQAGEDLEEGSARLTVAMVGDGINDAPALTVADVGIAVGSGSDIAISSADFVLIQSNLESVVSLLQLSKAVFTRIKFNFGWALVYNLIAVPVAAGCLYGIQTKAGGHVRLDPVFASLAMALSSISVVLSSLALRLSY